ncbi:MAG: DUF177 domain-containing protein [Chloroflexi bacterium]|nr:DUF177 domain-containing protein [Chloroflexota bacterium]
MRFNVAQLLKESVGETRRYELAAEKTELTPAIDGEVEFLRTHRSILVRGRLKTTLSMECGRCLDRFEYPLSLEFQEEYFPSTDMVSGEAVTEEKTSDLIIDAHHVLDLTEVVRQLILLNTPMNPLCRPDCLGLCPYCGHNLNQGSCGCTPTSSLPRASSSNPATV